MTLVEFLHPVRRGSNREKCLAAMYYLHHYQAVGTVSIEQVRLALRQARVSGSKSMNLSDVLSKAGHLVDYAEAAAGKRFWKLTAAGEQFVRELLVLSMPPIALKSTTSLNVKVGTIEPVHRVVVELDLSRYSDIARLLEENLGAEAVRQLNAQVEKLVEMALNSVDAKVSETRLTTTGDGAILAFESATKACQFAQALHYIARDHNLEKTVSLAQRHFRIGISSGEVILTKSSTVNGEFEGFSFAGTTIVNAVRSEAAAKTGEVLISSDTWADLPREFRKWYGAEEVIRGKRDEMLRVHRRKVVDPAPWDDRN